MWVVNRLRTLGDTPGTVTTWSYSGRADNLVTGITTSPAVVSFAYSYDANKNKLSETLGAPMASYGFGASGHATVYDDEDRLTAWERDDGNLDQSWSLSAVGDWNAFTENQTTQNRTHDAVHELTAIDQTVLAHLPLVNLDDFRELFALHAIVGFA